MNRHPGLLLVIVATLLASSGATCPRARPAAQPATPVALTAQPSLDDLIQAVNANTDAVRQLQSESASVSVPQLPRLRANLALERPHRFRLRADLIGGMMSQVDLGSNDQLVWIWARAFDPPAVYYARHEQWSHSAGSELLPVEPSWLIDALGLVRLDPRDLHEGPYADGPNRLQIVSRLRTASGQPLTRVLIVHDAYAWVLEQHLLDESGRLLASAVASRHRYYPAERVSLPHRVEIQLADSGPMSALVPHRFQLETNSYTINRLSGDPSQLFALPSIGDAPPIDLADPRLRLPTPSREPPPLAHSSPPLDTGSLDTGSLERGPSGGYQRGPIASRLRLRGW